MTNATRPLRVLCVDDDVFVLGLVTETLQSDGFDVHTAVDGAHALQKIALEDRPYDLIIADGRMPRLDGWKFIMQARTGGFKGKIIVFSAYIDDDERKRYHSLAIDRILEKPTAPIELLRNINEVIASDPRLARRKGIAPAAVKTPC